MLKLLRSNIKDLKKWIVSEVEPEDDELEAIREGEKEYKAGKHIDWKVLKKAPMYRIVNRKSREMPYCTF